MKTLVTGVLVVSLAVGALLLNSCDTNKTPSSQEQSQRVADSNQRPVSPPVVATIKPALTGNRLRVWRDNSSSANEAQLKQKIDELCRTILADPAKFDGIEVVLFANGETSLWSEPTVEFIWGAPPASDDSFTPDTTNAPIDVKMFKTDRDEYVQQQQADFEGNRRQQVSEYSSRVQSQLADFRNYVLQAPKKPAPCTRFTSLRQRIARENSTSNLIITDGWADCGEQAEIESSPVKINGKLVVLLLTRKLDSQLNEDTFPEREKFVRRLFPTAEIVPGYMTAPTLAQMR